jgi:phosphoglycolate phosphatase-like HAD superfamily hydrolase
MMDLVLFDIDGTLIRSMKDDGECLVAALGEVFGFTDIEDDWSCYEHSTDAGIMIETFNQRRGHAPSTNEIEAFCECFVELLAERCFEHRLEEVAGAGLLLAALEGQKDITVAYATGCFRRTAALKMQSARLSFDQFSSATCDDSISRVEIMQIAIGSAAADRGVSGFENTVYIGDGVWDVWACRRLGLPFIGITADVAADRLSAEGIEFLLPDFRDQELFHEYRERSCIHGD